MSTPNDRPSMPEPPDRVDYQETLDITEVHAAIEREHSEPTARTGVEHHDYIEQK